MGCLCLFVGSYYTDPFVENDVSVGGSVAPRGQPSPPYAIQVYQGNPSVNIYCNKPPADRPDLNQVWMFRTVFFDTKEEAELNAEAGNLFFIAAVDVFDPAFDGEVNTYYHDTNAVEGTDQIELDNFGIPTFRYVIYSQTLIGGVGVIFLSRLMVHGIQHWHHYYC